MLYLNLDADGYLLSVSATEQPDAPALESLERLDLSGARINAHRWTGSGLVLDEERLARLLAEEAETRAGEEQPTLEERNRADIDFLLIMGGYDI